MPGHHCRLYAQLMEQCRHTKAKRLNTGQVKLGRLRMADPVEPPARIIFPEPRRLHQRQDLEFERVGGNVG